MKATGKVASDRPTWASRDGSPSPLGATWIPSERAYNFALYSKYADKVTLFLYDDLDTTTPVFTYQFDYLKNKTGRVWHARIPKNLIQDARYYVYSIDGPPPSHDRFERHSFNPGKILLDPYARSVFFPASFDRTSAIGPGRNAGQAPLAGC